MRQGWKIFKRLGKKYEDIWENSTKLTIDCRKIIDAKIIWQFSKNIYIYIYLDSNKEICLQFWENYFIKIGENVKIQTFRTKVAKILENTLSCSEK